MMDSTMTSVQSAFRTVPRTGVIYVMGEAMAKGFKYGHPEWINLGQGAPQTDTIPGCLDRLTQIRVEDSAHEYSPVSGQMALREAVANLYNVRYRRGMPTQYTAENVAISSGGRVGLTRIAAALGPIHLGHLLPDYTAYEELLDLFRAFIPIPIVLDRGDGFTLTPEALHKEILGKGLGAILLSNPCNPTGQAVHGEDLAQWFASCKALGCWLITDEFYSHYLYDEVADTHGTSLSAASVIEDVNADPVLIVDGLTKNWRYPGMRLSWTVGPKDVIGRIASAGSFLDGGASHPIQSAAIPLLDPAAADQEAIAIQKAFGAKRELMLDRLPSMGLTLANTPKGAFYCFVSLDELPEPLQDGMAFFKAALRHQTIVVPGGFFDVNPGKRRSHIPSRLKQFVRLSFGPKIEDVARGLDRLESIIKGA